MEGPTAFPSTSKRLSLAIGQVPLTLHFPEEKLFEEAGQRYAMFRAAAGAGLPVLVEPRQSAAGQVPRFAYELDDASLHLGPAAAEFRGVRHEYALDSLLRILLSALLLPRRGFLLHAATVVRDARAYVFVGCSGAGKSTVASLSPPGSVLTDEISLLRKSAGVWNAHGTPFWGEFRAEGSNCRAPAAGVYALAKSDSDRLERLSAKEALRSLLPNILFFDSGKPETDELLKLLAEIAESLPFYRLYFRRHPDFWKVVLA